MTFKDTFKLSLIATAIITSANAQQAINGNSDDLPPAKPGQCFTKAFFPAKYATTTERVLASEPSEKVRIIPARYGWKSKKMKVSDGTERVITVPPTYKSVPQRILIAEESSKLIPIPAKYKTVTKRVLASEGTEKLIKSPVQYKSVKQRVQISPARTEWKKTKCGDRGCNQSEVVCLVEIPAVYKIVTKKVVSRPASTRKITTPPVYKTVRIQEMVTPPTTRRVMIPARYKTVMKRVINRPASKRTVKTPALYKTIRTKVLVQAAKTAKRVIPASYKTVTKKRMIADGYAKWVPIICHTSINSTMIRNIQRALKNEGFYRGPIDGIHGSQTKRAIRSYQKAKRLPVAGLSVGTMRSLGLY